MSANIPHRTKAIPGIMMSNQCISIFVLAKMISNTHKIHSKIQWELKNDTYVFIYFFEDD